MTTPTATTPSAAGVAANVDVVALGRELHELCAELYPLGRSLTGPGVRATLDVVRRELPLEVHEVPTGTPVLDWTVPREWTVRTAYVADATGRRVIDVARSNLHLVGYSVPVRRTMTLDELRPHLFTLPDQPDLVPYRTSYYTDGWGFCLAHRELEAMDEGPYEVVVDTMLADGNLTYAECVIPGASTDEILLSCHVCHPSLCNDNLSGVAVAMAVGRFLRLLHLHHTIRIVFAPGTIGAITWLAHNGEGVSRVEHGIVLSGLGDREPLSWKRSRRGDTPVDRAAAHVLGHRGAAGRVVPFSPYGYDERQYCSPGFDLAVGRLSRSHPGSYPEYHTSADDLSFITPASLAESVLAVLEIVDVLDRDTHFLNLQPWGEPQLGRRGLYRPVGGTMDARSAEMAYLWLLSLSDGDHAVLDVADEAGLPFAAVRDAADRLCGAGLLGEVRP